MSRLAARGHSGRRFGVVVALCALGAFVVTQLFFADRASGLVTKPDQFQVTGSATQNAGAGQSITLTALANGSAVTDFNGVVPITFNGGNVAPDGSHATVTDDTPGAVNFGGTTNVTFSNGVATSSTAPGQLSMTLFAAGTNTITAEDDTDGIPASTGGNQLTVTVSPLAATQMGATAAGTQTAGESQDITVSAYDQYLNVATGFHGETDVFFSGAGDAPDGSKPTVTDANGSVIEFGQATYLNFVSGVADSATTPGQLALTLYKSEEASIGADNEAISGYSSSSDNVLVSPGPLDHFAVEADGGGDIGAQSAGTSFNLQFTAQDAFDNVETGYAGKVDVSSSGDCAIGCTASPDFTSGVLTGYAVTVTQAGDQTITVTDHGGSADGTSNTFTVDPGSLDHFTVEADGGGDIGVQKAGVSFPVQFTAQDVYDNTATSYTGKVDVTSTSDCSSGCTTPSPDFSSGVLTGYAVTLTGAGDETVSVTDDGGTAAGTSNTFTVGPAALDHFIVNDGRGGGIGTGTAGVSFRVHVLALDQFGNVEDGYTGAVDVSSNVTCSVGCGNSGAFSGGANQINVTLTKAAANVEIDVVDLDGGTAAGQSNTFTVVPAAANHLTVTSNEASVTSGATKTLTAEIRDAFENKVDSSASVTFALTSGPGSVTGAGMVSAVHGVATKVVTGKQAGSLEITASAPGLSSWSTHFSVVHGAAAKLEFTSATTALASGMSRTLTAKVEDANGNDVPTPGHSVTFAKAAGSGTLSGLGTVSSSSGVASKAVHGVLAGSVTVHATASGLTAASTTFTVTPGAAAKLVFTSATTALTSGSSRTLTAKVEDAAGNGLTSSGRSVTFAKTAGAGTVTGLATVSSSSGIASKAVTGALAGSVTITASSTGLTSASSTFSVTPGAAKKLVFASSTASLAVGGARTLTVKVEDAAGNLVTTPDHSVTFAKVSGTGTASGLPHTVTSSNGVATASITATKAGAIAIHATASGLTAGSVSFTITS